jgi:two-component system response regulator AtoC
VDGAAYETLYAPLLSHSAVMRTLRARIERVADTDVTVLIDGESGVGKEVVARAIHVASSRRRRPFIKVNCAALPGELLESELFGHEKGAFTGAYRRKPGTFELADGGTLLLDEIAELPLGLQAKLLHVLQDLEFARVGGSETTTVDVRILAATNRPLDQAVRAGVFREDLYYRLKVVTITIPPLRERREEICVLARLFVERYNGQYSRSVTLSEAELRRLSAHPWPGNVRELDNLMKRMVVLGDTTLLDEELPAVLPGRPPGGKSPAGPAPTRLHEVARRAALEAQRAAIVDVLERVQWNRAEAARLLRISYKSLLAKIDQCGLARKRPRAAPPAGPNRS